MQITVYWSLSQFQLGIYSSTQITRHNSTIKTNIRPNMILQYSLMNSSSYVTSLNAQSADLPGKRAKNYTQNC